MSRASIRPNFAGGPNIAMKISPDKLDEVVGFYRDLLGFPVAKSPSGSWKVDLGQFVLWLDLSETGHGQIWLELVVPDAESARNYLAPTGVIDPRIEALPNDYPGFWIRNPAGFVHLISEEGA
jgi:hypothetical protein